MRVRDDPNAETERDGSHDKDCTLAIDCQSLTHAQFLDVLVQPCPTGNSLKVFRNLGVTYQAALHGAYSGIYRALGRHEPQLDDAVGGCFAVFFRIVVVGRGAGEKEQVGGPGRRAGARRKSSYKPAKGVTRGKTKPNDQISQINVTECTGP